MFLEPKFNWCESQFFFILSSFVGQEFVSHIDQDLSNFISFNPHIPVRNNSCSIRWENKVTYSPLHSWDKKKKHSGGFGTHGDRQDLCRGVTRTAAQKTHSTETVVNTKKAKLKEKAMRAGMVVDVLSPAQSQGQSQWYLLTGCTRAQEKSWVWLSGSNPKPIEKEQQSDTHQDT